MQVFAYHIEAWTENGRGRCVQLLAKTEAFIGENGVL